MRALRITVLNLCFLFFVGCASIPPQSPVAFSENLAQAENTIAVSIGKIPDVAMTYPGASCLLCLGVAAMANSGVSGEVKKLNSDDLKPLGEQLISKLEESGHVVKVLDKSFEIKKLKKFESTEANAARKDYRPLKDELQASHLLVMNFSYVGVQRDYASYIPTGEPYAVVDGLAYLIDLTSNIYEWYLPIHQRHYPGLEWKEPPSYPSVINAYYQAIETTKEQVLSAIGVDSPSDAIEEASESIDKPSE